MFFVSLIPFTTAWASNSGYKSTPVFLYGLVIFCSAMAYQLLMLTIRRAAGKKDTLGDVIIRDRRNLITVLLYAVALPLAYLFTPLTYILYIIVAVLWILPDIEQK
jgi:uncharacterized membrane protein